MAEPDWNPDTGGRSLAEILREAGIERPPVPPAGAAGTTPRRPASGSAGPRPPPPTGAGFGRRKSDLASDAARDRRDPATAPDLVAGPAPDPPPRPSPGCGPTGSPASRAATPRSAPVAPARERRGAAHSAPPTAWPPSGAPRARTAPSGPRTGGRRPAHRAAGARRRPPDHRADPRRPARPDRRAGHRRRRPDATPQESALAWLRFAGELVIALAAGVGVYFAATVLWEMIPHVAALLAPLAVTGLVGGVGMWRHRQGREPVGPRLLAILVFAGTLLTIFPAAELLSRGS